MIALVFVTCMHASPDICREQSLMFGDGRTPRACMRSAQPELARWAATHPQWRVTRWSCRNAEERRIKT